MYSDKVVAFFDQLMDTQFAGKPFMRHYLDYYFDIYWDLHLGVKGEAIPKQVRQIGEAFNTGQYTIFGIMSRLSEYGGDSEVRNAFHKWEESRTIRS